MAKSTKAPTGLAISRSNGVYNVSWKCGDKNYSSGQQFQYRINSGVWIGLSVAAGARSRAVSLNMANYYPTRNVYFSTFSVRIRGKKKGGAWSAWATTTYTNYVPNVPSLTVSLDDQQTNKCTFTWNLTTEATDARPYTHVRMETILVKESNVTDGSKLKWSSDTLGWATATSAYASGSPTITEDTALLANASYTRWYRVCARGARGSSAWNYAKHVYARPYQAKIKDAKVTNVLAGGMTCYAEWIADQSASHPIDYTSVQYVITVPDSGLTCPSGAQWNEANISADTAGADAVRFSIDNELSKDGCLFVRVNTTHDSNTTYSVPFLAAAGFLKDPTDLGYQVDNTNHTLTSVSVDNNSDVADSFIVLVYRSGSKPEDEIAVGIIPHGASQPLVTPVQCPDWSGESAFSIGAYAAVGTYEANSVGYTVKAKMRSASTIWVGGAVPVAPENVNVVQSPITGTATVNWDWTWEEANFAQLSWTDHNDAWESTDEPEIYSITKPKATKWNISGLELGKKWYIAVRLVSGNPEEENAIYSPWSDMRDIILSSVPNVPSLNLSARVITEGEEITASWDFVSNDGTGQISAEIKDEDDNLIAHTETQKEAVIDTEALGWSQGETHSLSVRVTSESNRTTEWSNPVSIVVAEALEGSIAETSLETREVNARSFEKTDFLSFLTEQEEVFTKLQVDLDPIQDLTHGDPSPSNICPISGHTEVNVVRTGKNLCPTSNFDRGQLASGTYFATNTRIMTDYIPIEANTDYYMSVDTDHSANLCFINYNYFDENKTWLGDRQVNGDSSISGLNYKKVKITNANAKWLKVVIRDATDGNTSIASKTVADAKLQVEKGSTYTDYEPYEGETYTTALGRTVYGGTLDVVSGVLTVTHGNIASYNGETLPSTWISDRDVYASGTTPTTGAQVVYELATPQTYQLTPQQINTLLGQNNVWSEDGEIEVRIAESSGLALTQMPLTVKLAGVNNNIISTLTIERTADYHMDRPDETQFDGFEGEIVYLTAQNGGEDIIINQEDLIGLMDDEAHYRVFVTFKDVYGQSMSDSVNFEVHWDHQAIVPEASVEIDEENLIAKLTPIAPTGTLTGDTCDIYRLSADRPELIVKNATFGTQYVDPYPAIGEFGGHRFVFKTVNGDYITADNNIAWTDTGLEEGDILESERAIIDFDGNQLLLYYNVDVGHQWDKDFQQTKYLGGSVQGDWNAGVSRSGSMSATMITLTDAEQIRMMRELAVYTGVCHVRTTDGSSYTADVQVSEDRDHDDYGKLASFSLTITRVDAETLDGLTYQQWAEEE